MDMRSSLKCLHPDTGAKRPFTVLFRVPKPIHFWLLSLLYPFVSLSSELTGTM